MRVTSSESWIKVQPAAFVPTCPLWGGRPPLKILPMLLKCVSTVAQIVGQVLDKVFFQWSILLLDSKHHLEVLFHQYLNFAWILLATKCVRGHYWKSCQCSSSVRVLLHKLWVHFFQSWILLFNSERHLEILLFHQYLSFCKKVYERLPLKAQILQIVLKCVRALARIVGRALGGGTFMHQAQKKSHQNGKP